MPHNRIVISGTLGLQETWETSLRFVDSPAGTNPAIDTIEGLTTWAQNIADDLSDTLNILKNALSTNGKVTGVQAQVIADGGTLVLQGIKEEISVAGLGTQTCPYQCAVVISDLTLTPGGRYRGRHYWPMLAPGLNISSRLVTPTLPADIAENWIELVQLCQTAAPGADPIYVMYSPTRSATTDVVAVKVGDVIDTQRRRRDALVENYATFDVPGV